MAVLVAAYQRDVAGVNIIGSLIEKFGFWETDLKFDGMPVYRRKNVLAVYTRVDGIHASNLDKYFKVDAVIFASRHKSESERPTLTVHVPGNPLDTAPYGGRPKELAWASPQRMKAALIALYEGGKGTSLGYSISLEATHHGPTRMEVPVLFIEIGSSPRQWMDERAGDIAAEAVWEAATKPIEGRSAVGFGGGHYAPRQTKVSLEMDVAVGHILPKYVTDKLDEELVKSAFRKTWGGCELAVLDWKGIRRENRRKLVKILEKEDIEIL